MLNCVHGMASPVVFLQFVEVKGPGDRLSHKQIVWLSDLIHCQCEVEVCRVKGMDNVGNWLSPTTPFSTSVVQFQDCGKAYCSW